MRDHAKPDVVMSAQPEVGHFYRQEIDPETHAGAPESVKMSTPVVPM